MPARLEAAPSASIWSATRARPSADRAGSGTAAVLVAGPGKECGVPEVHAIAAKYPDPTVLIGADATPAAAMAAPPVPT